MAYCTFCGREIPLFRTVRVSMEIDYSTGLYITHHNVCPECNRAIAKKNDWYRDFVNFFNSHPGKLEALEAIHESELQL